MDDTCIKNILLHLKHVHESNYLSIFPFFTFLVGEQSILILAEIFETKREKKSSMKIEDVGVFEI